MGHDIIIKSCISPYDSKCCNGGCDHEVVSESYISFNFTKYEEYWHIRDLHGHTGSYGLNKLRNAAKKLRDAGITAEIKDGEDGWSSTPNVYFYHIQRIIKLCEEYPNCRFYSDQVWKDPDTDSDTE